MKTKKVLSFSLFFQCRYTATSVHALVIELLPSDPPQPVASLGPVRVLMQLANGQCTSKGCDEGMSLLTFYGCCICKWFHAISNLGFRSGGCLHLFLHVGRLSSAKNTERTCLRPSWSPRKDWSISRPDTWSLLDNHIPQPPHFPAVGHFDQRVPNTLVSFTIWKMFYPKKFLN